VSREHATLPAGVVIDGRYTVVDAIGAGMSGTVYQVRKLGTDEEVALKLMHAEHPDSETERRRFAREAEVVKQLLHPNVVPLLDYGHRDDGVPFLVFTLLRGQTLEAKLQQEGALTWATTARISLGVLRALEKAHGLGIVHRDIKPGNIFLVTRPLGDVVQVVDFGLAKVVGEADHADARRAKGEVIIGTPRYMAPEEVRGGRIGHEVDIYALGLVIGEMLVGKPLVTGESDIDIYVAQGSDRPIELPALVSSSPFGPVVQRAVSKEVQVRYHLASQMLADLLAAIERVGMVDDDAEGDEDDEEDMVATAFLDPEAARHLLEASPHSQRMRDAMNLAASRAERKSLAPADAEDPDIGAPKAEPSEAEAPKAEAPKVDPPLRHRGAAPEPSSPPIDPPSARAPVISGARQNQPKTQTADRGGLSVLSVILALMIALMLGGIIAGVLLVALQLN
jgi:serine/threonine protein kinase